MYNSAVTTATPTYAPPGQTKRLFTVREFEQMADMGIIDGRYELVQRRNRQRRDQLIRVSHDFVLVSVLGFDGSCIGTPEGADATSCPPRARSVWTTLRTAWP